MASQVSQCLDIQNTSEKETGQTVIKEGGAEILVPSQKNIFYNPVQEFNRDLSVAVLSVFAEQHFAKSKETQTKCEGGITAEEEKKNSSETIESVVTGKKYENGINILEAFAASGLRSIRYAKEVPGINSVVANDISNTAIENIKCNIKHNDVVDLVTVNHDDAALVMYQHRNYNKRFHAVDLDPYGSPAHFLDAAVQSVKDGGMLLVTCTDMAVLCGNAPETCHAKYGSVSLKSKSCHEIAIRILLRSIESHANRYSRYIVPVLSVSADFYIRVFVKIYTSAATCKQTISKLSWLYQCVGCEVFTLQPLGIVSKPADKPGNVRVALNHGPPVSPTCDHCKSKHHIGGPIWNGPIHDLDFVTRVLFLAENGMFGTSKRMTGMLTVILEELGDVPLYYSLDRFSGILHCQSLSMTSMRSAILNAGYRVSYSHTSRTSVKTDAPPGFLWDIFRVWVRSHPIKQERLNAVSEAILSKEPSFKVNMIIHEDVHPESKQMKLSRYPVNPGPYWGPGTRSTICIDGEKAIDKRKKNQGKKKRKHENASEESISDAGKLMKKEEER